MIRVIFDINDDDDYMRDEKEWERRRRTRLGERALRSSDNKMVNTVTADQAHT